MEEIKTRKCKKCGRELPMTSDYYELKEKCKDGYSPVCWECKGRKFGERQIKQKWTDEDIDILNKYYKTTRNEDLIKNYFPTRTVSQIQDFATKKLKLHKEREFKTKLSWKSSEEDFLIQNYDKMSYTEMSQIINKSPSAISDKANKLGLRKYYGESLISIEELIKKLSENNITIVKFIDEYKGRYSKFEISCENNHNYITNYAILYRNDFKCIHCKSEENTHGKIQYEELYKMFTNKGYVPLFDEGSYENCKSDLSFICEKHNEFGEQTTNYLSIKNKECSCKYCQLENKMGENSYNWRGGVSQINEYLRTCIYEWKQLSMKNCNYTCIITGLSFDIIIHHLYNFNKISDEAHKISKLDTKQDISHYTEKELLKLRDIFIKLHYEYGLGVCLNETIHKLFHKINGSYDNCLEQFEEFKERYYNGEFDNQLEEEFKSYNSIKRLKELGVAI